jgi:hypothetical protein
VPARVLPKRFQVAFSFAGEQRELVRAIAEALEQDLGRGAIFFDEWFEYYIAGHDADLKLQRLYAEQCELVVVCVSARYGGKSWTQSEHEAVRARLMRARESAEQRDLLRILPIRVGDGDVEGIPTNAIIPDVRERTPSFAAELIRERLRLIQQSPTAATSDSPPHVTWPREPTPFKHGLADRTVREWPAVLQLLIADAPKRILIFRGPSGYSKSALLNAAAKYCKVLRAPFAYVDFKDTKLLSEGNLVRELQLGLGRILPDLATRKDPDRWALRHAFQILKGAALVLLDGYEHAADTRELAQWVETQLLAEVEESEHLRFIIGGQKVPDVGSARWRDRAELVDLDGIHDKSIWKDWIHEINPNVDEKHIEAFVLGLEGMPSNVSLALKTLAQKMNPPA